ncbi:MAG: cyclic nucleotide-binding domain-containing protein [Proteobacteria bacterium]|nr:cyclic nucleotide-binding domain-containing protein [Pseudomonadota bacterium]
MHLTEQEKLKIIRVFKKLPIFFGLRENEYDFVRAACSHTSYLEGSTIFNKGDGSPCLYILLTGEVELRTEKEELIHKLHPGEIFGEIGLITQQKRTATAIAKTGVTLLIIKSEDLNLLLGKNPRISSIIMRNITQHLANHIVRMNKAASLEHIPPRQESNPVPSSPGSSQFPGSWDESDDF